MTNNWSSLILVLLLIGGVIVPGVGASPLPELVRQGDFEAADRSGIGADWASESYGTATVRFSLDPDQPLVGQRSQHIQVEGYKEGGIQIRQLGFRLSRGKEYHVSLWLRGNLSAPVKVGLRKHEKPYTYYLRDAVNVSSTWRPFTISGQVDAEDPNAGLYIFFTGNGDLWIDSVTVKEIPPPEELNPLGLRARVDPTRNPDGTWHAEYELPWPPPGAQMLARVRVRAFDPHGERVLNIPMSAFLRDGLLVGSTDFRLPRFARGTYTICIEVPITGPNGGTTPFSTVLQYMHVP